MVNNFLHTLAVFAGLIIILPVLLGSILVAISRANKSASVLLSGFYGQIVFGGIGVIIHEMSHLISCYFWPPYSKREPITYSQFS